MEEIKFSSLKELYERITPALNTKRHELYNRGYMYVKNEDIWRYLTDIYWEETTNLTLGEMVDDIINMSDEDFINYLNKKINFDRKSE